MSLLRKLHEVRNQIAKKRQPAVSALLDELEALLVKLKVSHPYSLDSERFAKATRSSAFRAHLRGHVCKPDAAYLYRVCALGVLTDFAGWEIRTRTRPRWELHQQISKETAGGKWRPLSKYCSGPLSGRREFTWWSSLDLYVTDLCRAASRAGIPLDLLPPYPVILRLRVSAVPSTNPPRVPTAVDAWDMSVFDPMADDPVPPSGFTISLEDPSRLARGCDEFVLGPIPVEAIEFMALSGEEMERCGTTTGEPLWNRLVEYHQ